MLNDRERYEKNAFEKPQYFHQMKASLLIAACNASGLGKFTNTRRARVPTLNMYKPEHGCQRGCA